MSNKHYVIAEKLHSRYDFLVFSQVSVVPVFLVSACQRCRMDHKQRKQCINPCTTYPVAYVTLLLEKHYIRSHYLTEGILWTAYSKAQKVWLVAQKMVSVIADTEHPHPCMYHSQVIFITN